MRIFVTVGEDGQITIPADFVKRYGFKKGAEVELRPALIGLIVCRPTPAPKELREPEPGEDPLERISGILRREGSPMDEILGPNWSTDDYMRWIRGEGYGDSS